MKIKKINILLAICMLALLCSAVFAGTTGKITGVVKDADTGEPLPGANIIVKGTQMGAATNLQGEYIIINVPPGVYTLRTSMMGYKTHITQQVRVSIDLTTKINANLQPSVIEGEEVTIVAERPLVQMDKTSSLSSVGASQIKDMPVQSVNAVLEIQAGVVRQGGGFHIRGGRSDEVAFWVDGVPVTNVSNYSQGITVENNAVQELQVISGTFNAEYGQAMSGIVNIITKEGSPKYSGQVRGWVGDYVTNRDQFDVLDRVNTLYDTTGTAIGSEGVSSNPLDGYNKDHNMEASLSGPVPFTNDKVTFFTNARWHDYSGYQYGRNWFKPTGVPGDSSLVAMNQATNYSAQGKLTWKPVGGLKMSYNMIWNKYDRPYSYDQSRRYVPFATQQNHNQSQSHIFSLNHVLSPKTFYEVRVNYYNSESESYVFDDTYAMPDYYIYIYPDSSDTGEFLPEQVLYPHAGHPSYSAEDSVLFETLKQDRRQYEWVIDPDGDVGYIHPDSNAVPTSYSFLNDGMGHGRSKNRTTTWIGKFDISSQVNKYNLIKAGLEVRSHELESHSFDVIAATDPASNQEIVPFTPSIPAPEIPGRSDYIRNPREFSGYIQDKIEFKEVILNVGVRFDWFDANYVVPADPDDPDAYHPMKNKHIYRDWQEPPAGLNQSEYEAYMAGFEEFTLDERRSIMQKDVSPKMQVSPRLGIAYPISDAGVIHFSYGHFFQTPQYNQIYQNPDFKIDPSGSYNVFGNADLDAKKTVQYEIGLQQQLTRDLGIDITVFYKDIRDWVGTSPLHETVIPSVLYSSYENKDYSNVRGITFKLEKRYANNFSANLDYSFQIAEGSYSNPNDAFNSQCSSFIDSLRKLLT